MSHSIIAKTNSLPSLKTKGQSSTVRFSMKLSKKHNLRRDSSKRSFLLKESSHISSINFTIILSSRPRSPREWWYTLMVWMRMAKEQATISPSSHQSIKKSMFLLMTKWTSVSLRALIEGKSSHWQTPSVNSRLLYSLSLRNMKGKLKSFLVGAAMEARPLLEQP